MPNELGHESAVIGYLRRIPVEHIDAVQIDANKLPY